MLKIFKYLRYGKEKILSRKVVYSDWDSVHVLYTTNWGRQVIACAEGMLGFMQYGFDRPDEGSINAEILEDISKESLIRCILDAETYIKEQIKSLQVVQSKLFMVNIFYRGAFSEDGQKLLRKSLKINEDIKQMAMQIQEYKRLIEENDTNQA